MSPKPPPRQAQPIVGLLMLAFGLAAAVEFLIPARPHPLTPQPLVEVITWVKQARAYATANWLWLLPTALCGLVAFALCLRYAMLFWHNVVVAKLAGTELALQNHKFKKRSFDLQEKLSQIPDEHYFIGLTPAKEPVLLTERDLCTHIHLMGQTGSGKTASVITPLLLQCMRPPQRKGVLFMDAKGSSENVAMMQELAERCHRRADLRVFALAYAEWSHTYNPVWPCHDPDATAERVFSVFNMENEYYRGQAWLMFRNLVRLAASTNTPFNLLDIRTALVDDGAREDLYDKASDVRAQYEIESQLAQLDRKRLETFTGLYNALADYDHPLLNSYNPTIILEELVNGRQICYFNLPANRFPILAPAIGKIVLQHLQAIGAMRQIDRQAYDQHPFTVCIDELNRFAFPNLVPALCMLRDAKMQFVLSHQSLGDLDQVSPVFSTQVGDNTRCKIYLYENDPEHLEKVSRAYGTRTTFKRTVRFSLGPLLTFLNTGEVSNREVEEFVLHPNALKGLQPYGQGYVLLPDRMYPVNLEILKGLAKSTPEPAKLVPRGEDIPGLGLLEAFVGRCQKRRAKKLRAKTHVRMEEQTCH